MFHCQKCDRVTAPGEQQTKVVIEVRPRKYTSYYYNEKGEYKTAYGTGTEIVREEGHCKECVTSNEEKGTKTVGMVSNSVTG